MAVIAVEDYSRVESTYLAYESVFVQGEEICHAFLEIGVSSDWDIFSISSEKRICHKFEGCVIPLYSFIFWIIYALIVRNFIHVLGVLLEYSSIGMNTRENGSSFPRPIFASL